MSFYSELQRVSHPNTKPIQDIADKTRQFGDDMFGYYTGVGKTAQGRYDAFDDFMNNLPANQPHQVNNYYNQVAGSSGPTQQRKAYDTTMNWLGGQRDPYADAYSSNLDYYGSPSNIDQYAGSMAAYGGGQTNAQGRYDQRLAQGSPSYDANRYNSRLGMGGPTYLSDRLAQRKTETAPEFSSDLMAELGGHTSAANGMMMADPTKTMAIGDLYNNILLPQDSGPGYSEDWYMQTLNGTNPYYDRLRQQTAADAERRAAASGTFNAGRSQKLQNDAIAELDAQQFKDQGALASAADQAKEARLGTLTTGAGKYEDTVLANRKYNLDVANTIDTMTGKEDALRSDLAQASDKTRLQFGEDQDALAGKTSDAWFKQQEDLDALAHNASGEWQDNQKALDAAASSADQSEVAKRNAYINYLNSQDNTKRLKVNDQIGAARDLRASQRSDLDQMQRSAQGASNEEQTNRDFLAKLAQGASSETGRNLDAQQSGLLASAAARAGIDLTSAGMAGGALTDAQMHALQLELQKAGMDAKGAADILHAFTGLIGGGLNFLTGGFFNNIKKAGDAWGENDFSES